MRTTLMQIQSLLLPPLEVMKHELSLLESLMTRDLNLSTKDSLNDLVATMEIQLHSLEVAKANWESINSMTQEIHSSFLNKHSLSVIYQ